MANIGVIDIQPAGSFLLGSSSGLLASMEMLSDTDLRGVVGGGKTRGSTAIVYNLAYGFDPHSGGLFAPITTIVDDNGK